MNLCNVVYSISSVEIIRRDFKSEGGKINHLMKMKKSIIISIIAIAFMLSCKKEKLNQLKDSPSSGTNITKSQNFPIKNTPKIKDGILIFDSQEHLYSYYNYLDEIVEKGYDNNLDSDSLLKEIEDKLEFKSYRQHFINNYDWEDKEFSKEEIEELYKEDYIFDDIRKSILNQYLEVIIANDVYIYYSENKVIKVPIKLFDVVLEIRNIKKKDDYELPIEIFKPGIELISNTSSYSNLLKASDGDYYYPNFGQDAYSCDVFKKAIYVELRRSYDTTIYNNYNGTQMTTHKDISYRANKIEVDFGDNSPIHTVYNDTDFWVDHEYTSTGNYTVKATYTYTNFKSGAIVNLTEEFTIAVNGSCTSRNSHSYGSQNDGSWELAYKLWTKEDFFGKHLASYSHSWKKNNRGRWKRKKANLFCRVEGVFRNSNCYANESLAKSKTTYGKKLTSKKHRNKKFRDIQNGDCKSSHSFGGGSWYDILVLNPC